MAHIDHVGDSHVDDIWFLVDLVVHPQHHSVQLWVGTASIIYSYCSIEGESGNVFMLKLFSLLQ